MKLSTPLISIVMPVYNTQDYLSECLASLSAQRFKDFEVIFVDDGSTDGSLAILEEFAAKEQRASIVRQKNAGAGAARNKGLELALGEFVIFLDSDDIFSPKLLSTALDTIQGKGQGAGGESQPADVAAFNFSQFDEFGNEKKRVGVHVDWLKTKANPFCYTDCPDCIMSIVNPTPWNKLYRRQFLLDAGLRFDEIPSTNDIAFAAVSIASAKSVAYTTKSLLKYRFGRSDSTRWRTARNPKNVVFAVESAVSQAQELPYANEIKGAIRRFAIDNYLNVMGRYELDFDSPSVKEYYDHVHHKFSSPEYAELSFSDFSEYPHLYQDFDAVRRHAFDEMGKLRARRLIVSLTSYPARIGYVATALASILEQERHADLVVLYLAASQFPGGIASLPDDLAGMVDRGEVELRWCDADLGPHKKYFYALQEFKDDVVVTIDDDLIYHKSLLKRLWKSYLQFPHAISAARTHLITRSDDGEPLPYKEWLKSEMDYPLHVPSMQLIATGAGGILYPPNSIADTFLDESLIRELCPHADDLWLKAAQMVSGTPVVRATKNLGLRYIEGSQDSALWHENLDGGNDQQPTSIRQWLERTYGSDVFAKTLHEHRGDIDGIQGAELYLRVCQTRIEALEGELRRARSEKRQAESLKGMRKTLIGKFRTKGSNLKRKGSSLKAKGGKLKRKLKSVLVRKPDDSHAG